MAYDFPPSRCPSFCAVDRAPVQCEDTSWGEGHCGHAGFHHAMLIKGERIEWQVTHNGKITTRVPVGVPAGLHTPGISAPLVNREKDE